MRRREGAAAALSQLADRVGTNGTERGDAILRFVEREGLPLSALRILDLGCGPAGISVGLARAAAHVVGLDYRPDKFPVAREQVERSRRRNVALVRGDGLALPFPDGTFDLVVLNGVLEWVPEGRPGQDPRRVQRAALREIGRVLRPEGHLYLAIENRYYPPHLLRDPHARMPLTAGLPRPVAQALSHLVRRRPYRTYIYSFWALSRLVRDSGFRVLAPCVPVTNYYFPVGIFRVDRPEEVARALREFGRAAVSPQYLRVATGRYGRAKFLFWRLIARLRLLRLFAGSFVFLCQKDGHGA